MIKCIWTVKQWSSVPLEQCMGEDRISWRGTYFDNYNRTDLKQMYQKQQQLSVLKDYATPTLAPSSSEWILQYTGEA